MKVVINGSDLELRSLNENSIASLINNLKLDQNRMAIALDGEIIPKELYNKIFIKDGSRIEIIQLMAGG
ncbi:sulfur carrier protein ThiS [Cytobacillus oceanisediminis]|uniref:sulfur carrier protein ThiS n=1 Tax=Cytobacillus oceanisediminis TaxID=665099 RepID=UPI00203D32A6|nr:sulfur carrier protein ThiS [Cytobacillus oceanisediminis]MCM3393135.1 sulfur carrier protein ThiS [Cytobacillus oceanisediminis]